MKELKTGELFGSNIGKYVLENKICPDSNEFNPKKIKQAFELSSIPMDPKAFENAVAK